MDSRVVWKPLSAIIAGHMVGGARLVPPRPFETIWGWAAAIRDLNMKRTDTKNWGGRHGLPFSLEKLPNPGRGNTDSFPVPSRKPGCAKLDVRSFAISASRGLRARLVYVIVHVL